MSQGILDSLDLQIAGLEEQLRQCRATRNLVVQDIAHKKLRVSDSIENDNDRKKIVEWLDVLMKSRYTKHYGPVVEYDYTISCNKNSWLLYTDFGSTISTTEGTSKHVKVTLQRHREICPSVPLLKAFERTGISVQFKKIECVRDIPC
jgi:hypothetical protein